MLFYPPAPPWQPTRNIPQRQRATPSKSKTHHPTHSLLHPTRTTHQQPLTRIPTVSLTTAQHLDPKTTTYPMTSSSAAASPKPPSPSAWPSSAKSTPSSPARSSSRPRYPGYRSSAPPTRTGSKATAGRCGPVSSAPSASCS